MTDLFDNPMGLCGFEFVEFASPTPGVLEPLFEKLGFTEVARPEPFQRRLRAHERRIGLEEHGACLVMDRPTVRD